MNLSSFIACDSYVTTVTSTVSTNDNNQRASTTTTNEHPRQRPMNIHDNDQQVVVDNRQTCPDSHFHNDDDIDERKLEKKGPTETTTALSLQVSFLN